MILQVLIRGKPETIEMLQGILAPDNPSAFVQEKVGAWLGFDIPGPEAIPRVVEDLNDVLDLAAGAMSLWANSHDRPRVTNICYQDPKTGRRKGKLFNAYSVVPALTPEGILHPTPAGIPYGAAVICIAQEDAAVARALSVAAADVIGWWELYILLEILRDSLAKRENRKSGSWEALFGVLSARYGKSVKRLQELKRTINYHRHFRSDLPAEPWENQEALVFVRTAVRDWIDGLLSGNN